MSQSAEGRAIKRNIRLVVIGVLVFSSVTIGALINKLSQPRILNKYELRDYGAILLDEAKPLLDFQLVNQAEQVFGRQQLAGKWTILFFGFTHCGDICPTTMAELARTYQQLKPEEKRNFNVVLVTVDPERDSPQVLERYVSRFHEDFIGLTGNPGELISFASQVNMAYQPGNTGADPQHSGNLVLINPDVELHGFFRPPFAHGSLRVAWRSLMASYKN